QISISLPTSHCFTHPSDSRPNTQCSSPYPTFCLLTLSSQIFHSKSFKNLFRYTRVGVHRYSCNQQDANSMEETTCNHVRHPALVDLEWCPPCRAQTLIQTLVYQTEHSETERANNAVFRHTRDEGNFLIKESEATNKKCRDFINNVKKEWIRHKVELVNFIRTLEEKAEIETKWQKDHGHCDVPDQDSETSCAGLVAWLWKSMPCVDIQGSDLQPPSTTESSLKRKRVTFSADIVEHEKRRKRFFKRGSSRYTSGRWVASDGFETIDTSFYKDRRFGSAEYDKVLDWKWEKYERRKAMQNVFEDWRTRYQPSDIDHDAKLLEN
ncbi:hypothetical protein BDV96DRAFT_668595, partial [Lophiotrema nucula]